MEISQKALDNLWTLVATTQKQVIVVDFFGDLRAYIVKSFSPKVRDVFFNEVRGAQDITDFSIHLPFQMAELNPVTLEDRIQSRPKKDFKFGHENYIWMISNKENVY